MFVGVVILLLPKNLTVGRIVAQRLPSASAHDMLLPHWHQGWEKPRYIVVFSRVPLPTEVSTWSRRFAIVHCYPFPLNG
jgi:hypothetical protein